MRKAALIRLNAKLMAGLRNEDFDKVVDWCEAQTKNGKIDQVTRVENVLRLFNRDFAGRLAEIKHAVVSAAFAYSRLTGRTGGKNKS